MPGMPPGQAPPGQVGVPMAMAMQQMQALQALRAGLQKGQPMNFAQKGIALVQTQSVYMGRGTGVIRMFNEDKGFGFVVQDGGGPDLFFHRKDLPKLLPCPHCSEPISIPCKQQGHPFYGGIDTPTPILLEGGKVTFKIELQPDGKMQAVDVIGDGVGAPRSQAEEEEDYSLYECMSCHTQFQAIEGAVVKCPGCGIEIELDPEKEEKTTGKTEEKAEEKTEEKN